MGDGDNTVHCPRTVHCLRVVGIGLDGFDGVTLAARTQLIEATAIAGVKSHLKLMRSATAQPLTARPIELHGSLHHWLEQLRTLLRYESVVVLASGDPLFFGFGRLLVEHFPAEQLEFYPHLSSVQLAFSRLQIPWQSATVVSIHGRGADRLEQALRQGDSPIAVLTDDRHSPAAIADTLRDLRLPNGYDLWVCSQLGGPTEQVLCYGSGVGVPDDCPQPNVVVLQRRPIAPLPSLPLVGIADSNFVTFPDRPGLMTKQEIRVLVIGLLQLPATPPSSPMAGIVWDVGAGTGSVSVELARMLPRHRVLAVEKSAIGIEAIRQNRQRFSVPNLEAIAGRAPEVLADLPSPCRVFIGGGGDLLTEILAVVVDRIEPEGIIVATFATLEACYRAKIWLAEAGWSVQLLQANLARSVSIAASTRFAPLNPIILLQAVRL